MKFTTIIAILLLGLTSCESTSKHHATRAILFSQHQNEPQKRKIPVIKNEETDNTNKYLPSQSNDNLISGNPIFIHQNTKFSVRVDEVNPGWIFREKKEKNPTNVSRGSDKISPPPTFQEPISKAHYDHFRGQDLWLLTTISSLDTNDPLETKSKRYFKATNVKMDAQSYALVPLDSEEKYIFTHESDSSYRIKFQLYKVDQFALKKEIAKISKNPGLVGTFESLLTTLKNTAGAIGGDMIQQLWDEKSSEPLALERFLLSINATEEFHGDVMVLRDGDFLNRKPEIFFTPNEIKALLEARKDIPNDDIQKDKKFQENDYNFPKPFIDSSYILLDYYKNKTETEMEKMYKYGKQSKDTKPNDLIGNVYIDNGRVKNKKDQSIDDEINNFGYITLSVLESYSAKSYIDNDGKLQVAKVPQTYQNELSTLSKLAENNQVENLKNQISNFESQCSIENSCDDQLKNKIIAKKSELENLINTKPDLINAIKKYEDKVRLDEWKEHLARQPD